MTKVESVAKGIKEERSERVAVIERKVVKRYRAVRVLEDLEQTPAIKEAIASVKKEIETLEANAMELMKQRFADLKKA